MIIKKRIISFTLCGNNPLYQLGAIENSRLALTYFPNWQVVVYVDKNQDESIITSLKAYGAIVIRNNEKYRDAREQLCKCTFWRFYPLDWSNIEYIIFRDADSRLCKKDALAVEHWIKSGKDFHLLYDHPQHTIEILAGMWGVKGNVIKNIKKQIGQYFLKYDKVYQYNRNYDQIFLKNIIYSKYIKNKNNYIAHGNPNQCQYHIERNIIITDFNNIINSDINDLFPLTGFNNMSFIGQTIFTPYFKKKARMVLS